MKFFKLDWAVRFHKSDNISRTPSQINLKLSIWEILKGLFQYLAIRCSLFHDWLKNCWENLRDTFSTMTIRLARFLQIISRLEEIRQQKTFVVLKSVKKPKYLSWFWGRVIYTSTLQDFAKFPPANDLNRLFWPRKLFS